MLSKYAKDHHFTNTKFYVDEGISGTSVKSRKNFQRMIRQCRQGKIDLILTKSLSRFSRNTPDVIKYTRELRNLGVSVIFEKESIDSIYPESEFLITLYTLYGVFAQSESESVSKNVSWGKRQAMKAGRAIIQYKRLLRYEKRSDGKPKIVPDQAETIRFIYDRYLAGDTLRSLKARLETDGVPYITGEAVWNISGLQSILQNEKYCGDVLLHESPQSMIQSTEDSLIFPMKKSWNQGIAGHWGAGALRCPAFFVLGKLDTGEGIRNLNPPPGPVRGKIKRLEEN